MILELGNRIPLWRHNQVVVISVKVKCLAFLIALGIQNLPGMVAREVSLHLPGWTVTITTVAMSHNHPLGINRTGLVSLLTIVTGQRIVIVRPIPSEFRYRLEVVVRVAEDEVVLQIAFEVVEVKRDRFVVVVVHLEVVGSLGDVEASRADRQRGRQ